MGTADVSPLHIETTRVACIKPRARKNLLHSRIEIKDKGIPFFL